MGYLYDFAGLREIVDYYDSKIKKGELSLKFIIVGDGGIYNSLKNHVNNIKADWVKLVGRVPFFDITEYIALADLCLLSFKINDITKEITPIKIIEYMAMRIPIIASKVGGLAELVEHEKNGLCVMSGSIGELINAINRLITDEKLRKKLSDNGFRYVKKFDVKTILLHFKDLYEELFMV